MPLGRRGGWGVSFMLAGCNSDGTAASLDEAKAAFRAEYECWGGPRKAARLDATG